MLTRTAVVAFAFLLAATAAPVKQDVHAPRVRCAVEGLGQSPCLPNELNRENFRPARDLGGRALILRPDQQRRQLRNIRRNA